MSINKKLVTATAAVSMALGVCFYAQHSVLGDDNNNTNQSQNEDQAKMEKMFFRMAASDNNAEIRLAKLAQERSDDDQVKKTAQMMQSDHEQANQLLFQIADQNHIDVSKDEMNDVDKAEVDAMEKQKGEVFTHMYVFGQVGDHARDELILAFHANNGKSEACRQYSTQVLPKIQMHLHALEAIARPMAGLPGMAEPAAEHMNGAQNN
jgi:putative membrane protein